MSFLKDEGCRHHNKGKKSVSLLSLIWLQQAGLIALTVIADCSVLRSLLAKKKHLVSVSQLPLNSI